MTRNTVSSFASRVRMELSTIETSSREEALAELCGFLKGRGSLTIGMEKNKIKVRLGSFTSLRRFYVLSKYLTPREKHADLFREHRLHMRNQGVVELSFDDVFDMLGRIHMAIGAGIPDWISEDVEYFGCFMRGMFLSAGSMADPRKHYHLEIVGDTEESLLSVRFNLMKLLGIKSGILTYRHGYKLYIKRSSDIIELLNLMGARKSAAEMEEIVYLRKVRMDTLRSYNFLSANAQRTGTSNFRQLAAIKFLMDNDLLDDLSDELRNLAILRLENEDLSLSELGNLMDPPMTKSMVFNRMKKILRFAEENGWIHPA